MNQTIPSYIKYFNDKIKYLVSKDIVTDLKCLCADKLKCKEYIQHFNLSEVHIPKTLDIIGKTFILSEVDLTKYTFPLYIKCNHGCKYNIFCNSIKSINTKTINLINDYINRDYYKRRNEYQYSKIDKLIYLEEFIPVNYLMQFYCFHGEPMYLECIKKKENHIDSWYCNEYDIKYNRVNITDYAKEYSLTPKPSCYDKLVEYTKVLCQEFDFVRVDYYIDINSQIWFSELTFSPFAGRMKLHVGINTQFGKLI